MALMPTVFMPPLKVVQVLLRLTFEIVNVAAPLHWVAGYHSEKLTVLPVCVKMAQPPPAQPQLLNPTFA